MNGTAAANGTNGHGPQPEARLGQVPADDPAGTGWQADQQIAEIPVGEGGNLGEKQAQEHGPECPAAQRLDQGGPRPPEGAECYALGQFNTPVRVDEIAVAAMALSENLQAATRGMPETVELRRFRRDLDQAASTFRTIASELEVTAGQLIRLAANEGQACGVGWGVCPEHGLTLMNVGETVSCHILGCEHTNEGAVERCQHPVAYRVVDAAGPSLLTCAGHAIACRLYLDNPVISAAADSMELF